MSLHKIHFDIVTSLCHRPKKLTELARLFNMSTRNIRYAIENINYYFEQLNMPALDINKGDLTYRHDPQLFFSNLLANQFVFDKNERDEYIAILALFQPEQTLLQIRLYLKISATTLAKDLKRINASFQELAVTLKIENNKLKVYGKEKQIRYLKMRYASKYFYCKYDHIYFLNKKYFFEKDIESILKIYLQNIDDTFIFNAINLIEKSSPNVIPSDFRNILTIYLMITLERIACGHWVMKKNNANFLKSTNLFNVLCQSLHWQSPVYYFEALHLTEYFLGGFNQESIYEKRFYAEMFTYQLLTQIECKFDCSLVENKTLIEHILSYLITAVYRAKNNLSLRLFATPCHRNSLFHQIQSIAENYEHYLIEPLREEEIQYLAHLIDNEITQFNIKQIPITKLLTLIKQHTPLDNTSDLIEKALASWPDLICDDRKLPTLDAIHHKIITQPNTHLSDPLLNTLKKLCDYMTEQGFVTSQYYQGLLTLLYANNPVYIQKNNTLICYGQCPSHSLTLKIVEYILPQNQIDLFERPVARLILICQRDDVLHIKALHQFYQTHILNNMPQNKAKEITDKQNYNQAIS